MLLAHGTPPDQLIPDWLAASSALGELGARIAIANLGLDLVELLVRGERKRKRLSPASSAFTK